MLRGKGDWGYNGIEQRDIYHLQCGYVVYVAGFDYMFNYFVASTCFLLWFLDTRSMLIFSNIPIETLKHLYWSARFRIYLQSSLIRKFIDIDTIHKNEYIYIYILDMISVLAC